MAQQYSGLLVIKAAYQASSRFCVCRVLSGGEAGVVVGLGRTGSISKEGIDMYFRVGA